MAYPIYLNGKFPISREDMRRLINGNVASFRYDRCRRNTETMLGVNYCKFHVKGITTGDYVLEMPKDYEFDLKDEEARIEGNMDANGTGSVVKASDSDLASGLLKRFKEINNEDGAAATGGTGAALGALPSGVIIVVDPVEGDRL